MSVSWGVVDLEMINAEGKCSVVEGRYVVCCVLEKRLKNREEDGVEIA